MKTKSLLFFCLFFAASLVGGMRAAQAEPDLSKPLDLKFTAIDGRKVDLAELRGKVVILDFWATWCPPCRIISPDILEAYKKYHSQGLEVIGISVDTDKTALLNFIKKEGVPWPQYFEDSASDNVIASKYGVDSFPTLWLVGKKGVVIDANLRDIFAVNGGLPPVTSPATIAKFDAILEKALQAP